MAHAKFAQLLFLLLFVVSSSSGRPIVESFSNPLHSQTSMKSTYDPIEQQLRTIQDRAARKLLEDDVVELDYDYAGPNPKHDPRRGRGGGRSL